MHQNLLTKTLPAPVGEALKKLGANLKTARVRREQTVSEVAGEIGVSRKLVTDAENGKSTTSAAVYVALIWHYGLLSRLAEVMDPSQDKVGLAGALIQAGQRVRHAPAAEDDDGAE